MADVNRWKLQSNGQISCGVGSKTSNLAQNLLITKAYAKLYIENPKIFKWAGMAAYASDMVGAGIATGKALDAFVDGNMRSLLASPPQQRMNATNLDNMLIEGNKAVYRDIFWQHLAFKEAGVEQVKKEISRQGLPKSSTLIEAWELIDQGERKKNPGLVWEGNTLLLQYEQRVTLQPIYDRYRSLSDRLSFYMVSPLPMHLGRFPSGGASASVANFDDRWRWIVGVLVPEWKRLDAGSMISEVRLIYMGHMPQRIICLFQ